MFRKCGKPPRKAAALGRPQVQRLIAGCDDTLVGARDRALLLLGFAGALRRSELVAPERVVQHGGQHRPFRHRRV